MTSPRRQFVRVDLGVGEMLGGRVLRMTARVLPLALVLGLFGASESRFSRSAPSGGMSTSNFTLVRR